MVIFVNTQTKSAMSVVEELHKLVDKLSEEQQQELLEVANQLLNRLADHEADAPELESITELNKELLQRYQHLREHPDQVVSARESSKRVRSQYGWS